MKILIFKNGTVAADDVFASSWGYEQTNVNFYQVISVHGQKTIVVREIRGVETIKTGMSGKKKPILNDFIGEPIKRQVKDYAAVPLICVEEYESAYKTTVGETHSFSFYG
jgi:hypothetical protein